MSRCRASAHFPRGCFRRVSAGASGSRDCRSSPGPLWLLDEPLAALDAAGAELLARMLAGHLAKGGLAVAATHAPLGLGGSRVAALVLG